MEFEIISLFEGYFLMTVQIGSNLSKLIQTCPKWFKLVQIGSKLLKFAKDGNKYFRFIVFRIKTKNKVSKFSP